MVRSELDRAQQSQPGLRALVLAIGVLETVAFAVFAGVMLQSSDPLGASIGRGMTLLMAIPYVALVLPGLVLAWANRALSVALALVVIALAAAAILWRMA